MISRKYWSIPLWSLIFFASASLAQPISLNAGGAVGPSTQTDVPMDPPGGGPGWTIGTPDNPVGVTRDPNAGPWTKNLLGVDTSQFNPGQIFELDEFVLIEGNLSWTNWEEDIITSGWEWAVDPIVRFRNGGIPPGFSSSSSGQSAQMLFDPLPSGTMIEIFKQLQWTGSGNFVGTIIVKEHPTPEPATIAILIAGLAGMGFVRRRRAA